MGKLIFYKIGGEGGIRTLDTLLTYTHFPGVRFQPLTHFTVFSPADLNTAQIIDCKSDLGFKLLNTVYDIQALIFAGPSIADSI